MRMLTCLALALLANLTGLSPAAASGLDSGATEATVSWRLGFGAGPVQPGYGLALGYRSADPDALSGRLLEIDVSDRAAFANLAGLPLFQRNYGAALDEGVMAGESGSQPWYMRKWVMWTAGGLAATLALTGSDGDVDLCFDCNGNGSNGGGSNIASVNGNGEVCGTEGVPGAPDTCADAGGCTPGGAACVNCNDSAVTQDCEGEGWAARPVELTTAAVRDTEPAWLGDGTGQMGDLIAR